MVALSDLRLMQVKGLPLRVLRDKIMAELQLAERLDRLEGCGEMPLHLPSVRGLFMWVADVRSGQKRMSGDAITTTALPSTAGIPESGCDVRKVPTTEVSSHRSTTLSARASRDGDSSMPSLWATGRLITS
jgi:hypothetical protein